MLSRAHRRISVGRAFHVAAMTVAALPIGFGADAASAELSGAARAPKPASVEAPPPPPPPAPRGVFGADMPAAGKLVFAITPSFFNLAGSRTGQTDVSNEQIVTTVPWFVNPKQTLRLVPQNIFGAVQTVALCYGVTKDFTLAVTTGTVEKNLEVLTFKGLSGAVPLGRSYTGTAGLADFAASGIYRVYQDEIHRLQLNLGFSFPTGSSTSTFRLLLPDGTYQTSRAFYGMQPGWGSFDILPGVVYAGALGRWSWGLSYRGRLPLAANPQNYLWGDLHEFNGWGGYTWIPGFTTTLRVNGATQGPIRGVDKEIFGRAQSANPAFYGGQKIEIFGGAAVSGKFIGSEALSVLIEAGLPVYQNLNGPQNVKRWQAGLSLRWKI